MAEEAVGEVTGGGQLEKPRAGRAGRSDVGEARRRRARPGETRPAAGPLLGRAPGANREAREPVGGRSGS